MKRQEIFNQAANHMLTQGKRSMNGAGNWCAYRGTGGLKCAVGIFIPDDKYYPALEGNGVGVYEVQNTLPFQCTKGIVGLLASLQAIHDQYEPKEWKEELMYLAEDLELKVNFE